jgi:hypothetical protein
MTFALAGTVAVPAALRAQTQAALEPVLPPAAFWGRVAPAWALGVEGQRMADLGNGSYFNPIIAGDYPDPTVLEDGLGPLKPNATLAKWQNQGIVKANTTPFPHSVKPQVEHIDSKFVDAVNLKCSA